MSLFNVWHPQQPSKTTILAKTPEAAADAFCARWGFADLAHYLRCNNLPRSNLHVEPVKN
jgi:hypothetical protein